MRLIYHPKAEEELAGASRFYQERSPGFGEKFLIDFDAKIAEIQRFPNLGLVVDRVLRSRPMRRFPFSILYRVEGDDLRILVVKHHKRDAADWSRRLDD